MAKQQEEERGCRREATGVVGIWFNSGERKIAVPDTET